MTLPPGFGTFKLRSTYQSDFVEHDLHELPKMTELTYVDNEIQLPIKKPLQYDLEALLPYRPDVNVPFNLLFRTKDVIRQNPHENIHRVEIAETIFREKLEKRKLRPRVYMLPQISLDDVAEDIMYKTDGLADQIYTSDWNEAVKFSTEHSKMAGIPPNPATNPENLLDRKIINDKEAIDATRYPINNGIIPCDPRFLKYIEEWELLQNRQYIDQSKIFWNKYPKLGLCNLCEPKPKTTNLHADEINDIEKCIKNDECSIQYTVGHPKYSGYLATTPQGVNLRKKFFKLSDPYVTTVMQAQNMYIE